MLLYKEGCGDTARKKQSPWFWSACITENRSLGTEAPGERPIITAYEGLTVPNLSVSSSRDNNCLGRPTAVQGRSWDDRPLHSFRDDGVLPACYLGERKPVFTLCFPERSGRFAHHVCSRCGCEATLVLQRWFPWGWGFLKCSCDAPRRAKAPSSQLTWCCGPGGSGEW